MTVALRNIPKASQEAVIRRRALVPGGNGYNGARDAARKLGINLPSAQGKGRPQRVKRREIKALSDMLDEATVDIS